jgi:hypothetical protein
MLADDDLGVEREHGGESKDLHVVCGQGNVNILGVSWKDWFHEAKVIFLPKKMVVWVHRYKGYRCQKMANPFIHRIRGGEG